ncbi:nicotinate-nucleotide--dimethylbenzimidazole phosphoribosyltransferase [Streptomyces sp. NPDC059168]|uniref:nicotinate-nucleotide--dimethylbenzimidazole phosphoribosyltransferase n=1 Tax=Streptomyces sp. NPDC059168 TaxID=3346753 RepID=UPI003684F501
MTDTGQVPAEGQPESAGMVEQPGAPAHGAYTYLSELPAEDEDLLLPGAQGAWGNEVPPPAPEPVVETFREPGPHETAGRDSDSVDLSGVRLPDPGPASAPRSPVASASQETTAAQQPRRPLHLGPPIPNASAGPVRSLADRGPAGAPVRQSGPATTGPEYLDVQALPSVAPRGAAPWGAAPAAVARDDAREPAAETVAPAGGPEPTADVSGAAQAAVARLTTQVTAQARAEEPQAPVPAQDVHGQDGVQPAHGQDGVYAAPADRGPGAEGGPLAVDAGREPRAAAAPGADGAPVAAPPVPEAGGAPVAGAHGAGPGQALAGPDADGVADPADADARAQAAPVPEAVPAPAPAVSGEAAEPVQPDGNTARTDVPSGAGPEAAGAVAAPDAVPAAAVAPQDATESAEAVQPSVAVPAQAPGPVPVEAPEAAQAPAEHPSAVSAQAGAAVPAPAAEPLPAPDQAQASDQAQTPDQAPAPEAAEVPDQAPAPEAAEVPDQAPAPEAAQVPEPAEAPDPAQVPGAVPAAQPVAPAPEADTAPAFDTAPEADTAPESDTAPDAGTVPPAAGTVPGPVVPQAQGPQITAPATPDGDAAPPAQEHRPHAVEDAAGDGTPTPPTGPGAASGPQLLPAAETPAPAAAETASQPPLAAGPDPAGPRPSAVPLRPDPEQPLGQFVPVDGQVPTTPHLAPTPAHPIVLPAQDQQEAAATVPAPREAEPAGAPPAPDAEAAAGVVQDAEDLRTTAADQEDSATGAEEPARSAGPAAPAYDDAERAAVLKVMRERRDIRNGFRGDPIPHEVLLRVLEAAHTAPSVGHSQPWDFVVIRSADTRRAMHELAMRQRDAYAKSLPKGRAKQFKELKIEAILDTPVNIVVTADPTRGGRHTLGRHTQPQMAPYSAALAVENLWLAARAEGLGVGWVSFFDEREMVRALGLPEHLEVIAYLCVGYVDEFPDEPELMQAGWSKRRPLSWVVHEETYGRRALPGEEPHDLLAETVAQIRPLDAKALGEAWERQKRMTKPAGALGMLEIISAQLSGLSRQCPPPIPEPAAVAIFAGDHGVHAQGVTPWPQEVTAQMVANFLGGGAVCNAFAGQVGAEVCVVDVGVAADLPATPGLLPRKIRGGTSDMTTGPAMTREEAKAAVEVGIETARDLVAAGNKALLTGEMGIANTTASAALISVYTGADPAEVTGRGTGINDETLARKTDVVRRALELHQPDPADPIGVLAALGGFEHAALVGLLLGGASLRTPVILDGVSAGAAALVARAIAPEVLAACIAGHRSAEPGHAAALNKLGLRPLVDLDLRLGEGTGALLALPLVQSAARAMHEVATFDSAGVTEK